MGKLGGGSFSIKVGRGASRRIEGRLRGPLYLDGALRIRSIELLSKVQDPELDTKNTETEVELTSKSKERD